MSPAPTTLDQYVETRLLLARNTSFVRNGITHEIIVEDGLPRCSASHTLPVCCGAMTFRNFIQEHSGVHDQLGYALVEFYRNSLAAGEPMTANAIICHKDFSTPHPFLRRIHWDNKEWFIFNEKTGLLTDKWWHIFGCFPD